jgi:hypothetical protein
MMRKGSYRKQSILYYNLEIRIVSSCVSSTNLTVLIDQIKKPECKRCKAGFRGRMNSLKFGNYILFLKIY